MSNINSSTKTIKKYKHLNKTERENIERWLKEEKSKSEIARLLDRNRSTITREIKRGTVTQIKTINGYDKEIEQYYAEAGQAVYEKIGKEVNPKD